MGVFSYVDDGTIPGCAVLKLSDGRKRSMSLWVEFITASGYLSSRKIRSRFQTLVAQAVDRSVHRDVVRVVADTTEVRLRVRDRYVMLLYAVVSFIHRTRLYCKSDKRITTENQSINQSNNGHRCVMQLPIVLILLKNLSVRLFNLYLPKPVITVPSYRWLMRK